jgi:hypothetical protein
MDRLSTLFQYTTGEFRTVPAENNKYRIQILES